MPHFKKLASLEAKRQSSEPRPKPILKPKPKLKPKPLRHNFPVTKPIW